MKSVRAEVGEQQPLSPEVRAALVELLAQAIVKELRGSTTSTTPAQPRTGDRG